MANDERNIESEVESLISMGSTDALERRLDTLSPVEKSHLISHLDHGERRRLVQVLSTEGVAKLCTEIDETEAANLIGEMHPDRAAEALDDLEEEHRVELLRKVEDEHSAAIIRSMEPGDAADIRALLAYDRNTAGALMTTEFLSYPEGYMVSEVLDDLHTHGEQYSDYDVQYAYVTSFDRKLAGVLRLRDLLFAARHRRIAEIMIPDPISVPADMRLEELRLFFQDHALYGVPVVQRDGSLAGVVHRQVSERASERQANSIFLKINGIIGGEEFRSMPLRTRSGRRLAWLSINIVLNIIAASVIAVYEDVLAQVIALAVFLPIISDMSGCSGNQAVAVSIRELALGMIKPAEFLRVFRKEAVVGLINGIILGAILGLIAYIWKGSAMMGFVVWMALGINTVIAVSFGGLVPLMLKKLKFDPALVSGPLLTTITDMCGFFLALSMASVLLV